MCIKGLVKPRANLECPVNEKMEFKPHEHPKNLVDLHNVLT